MANEHALALTVKNPYPGEDGTPSLSGAGAWATPVNAYSFLVVAFYKGSGISATSNASDLDAAGWDLSAVANWNNFTDDPGSTQGIALSWTAARRTPIYYGVFWQDDTAYDVTANGVRAALVDGTVLTVTMAAAGAAYSNTFASSYTAFNLNPIIAAPTPREMTSQGYDGQSVLNSFANDITFERLDLGLRRQSVVKANYNKLLKFARNGAFIELEDLDTNTYIQKFNGRMALPPGSLNSAGKSYGLPGFEFLVDSEELR